MPYRISLCCYEFFVTSPYGITGLFSCSTRTIDECHTIRNRGTHLLFRFRNSPNLSFSVVTATCLLSAFYFWCCSIYTTERFVKLLLVRILFPITPGPLSLGKMEHIVSKRRNSPSIILKADVKLTVQDLMPSEEVDIYA